jgi:hypothetical protein
MEFVAIPQMRALRGTLTYSKRDFGFGFDPISQAELEERLSLEGTASLSLDTLQIEIDVGTGILLYAWGYCPHVSWHPEHLRPAFDAAGIRVGGLARVERGVSVAIDDDRIWRTSYDASTGWICVRAQPRSAASQLFEFASACVAELNASRLSALWLRPLVLGDGR